MHTITLVISGGIAAYKALELIRLLRKAGVRVIPVLTKGGAQFVTPLSASALAEEKVYTDLFSLTDEQEMGHIRLSRMADLVVVAPASADIIAKMAHGLADDLASTLLLATNAPLLIAPAMNPAMWAAPATRANIETLKKRGVMLFGPVTGDTACGEQGEGRMAEAADIFEAIRIHLAKPGPLAGKHIIVTAGPSLEKLDPVRFISNQSSGKQGYAIAQALLDAGAKVTLISGPVALDPPKGAKLIKFESADELLKATLAALPADAAICTAAVADWKAKAIAGEKIKKGSVPPLLELTENPDILAHISGLPQKQRPRLVIGFAAETQKLEDNANAKWKKKGCDWLLANDVSAGVFGADENRILFLSPAETAHWPRMSKAEIGKWLCEKLIAAL